MQMPRGSGARARRTAAYTGADVEGVTKALNADPGTDGPTTSLLDPADDALALIAEYAGKGCMNCGHMEAAHKGACTMDGCTCTGFEAEASFDAVEYSGTAGAGDLAVVGFAPSDDRFEAAIAELTHRSPDAEPLVRMTLEQLRLRRFAPASPAPALTEPLDAGGDLYTLEWEAILCPEGRLTEDGRAFAPGSIRWRELPLSLAAMLETQPGHDGARVCGRIDRIWRDEASGLIRAAGVFDDSEYGREIARMVADGVLRGNSVDIAPLEVEIGPASRWFDPEGNWIPQEEAAAAPSPTLEEVLFDDSAEAPIIVVNDAVIGMSTVCPFPAFADAHITVGQSVVAAGNPLVWTLRLDAGYRVNRRLTALSASSREALLAAVDVVAAELYTDGSGTNADVIDYDALAARYGLEASEVVRRLSDVSGVTGASGAEGPQGVDGIPAAPPLHPPAAWFANPNLDALTALVVTEDGQIYGHAAGWGSCHTGFPDVCVTPPPSETDYRFYHLKSVLCAEGTEVAVGTVTLSAPHADQRLDLAAATAHYDNTGTAAADVVVGEDEHGIWVAGAVRSTVTPEQIRELRGAVLSGDWRDYQGNLEMIALLAVNVPGFPIPRVRTVVAAGVARSLVAAGMIGPRGAPGNGPGPLGWIPPAVDALTAAKLAALASPELAAIAE